MILLVVTEKPEAHQAGNQKDMIRILKVYF